MCAYMCYTHLQARTHPDLDCGFRVPELERKRIWMGILVVRLCIYSLSIL